MEQNDPWISCEKELPADGQLVLIETKQGEIYLATKDGDWWDADVWFPLDQVAYWLPFAVRQEKE